MRYFDPDGKPMDQQAWVASFAHPNHIAVSIMRLRGQWYRVSTIWLGLNHNYGSGPPLIYETMIFEEPDFSDISMWRYSTAQEAMRGHRRAVRWLKRNVRETPHPQLIHRGRKPVGRPTKRK